MSARLVEAALFWAGLGLCHADALLGQGTEVAITEEMASINNARRPANEQQLKSWMENMVVHHRFNHQEIRWATGLTNSEIDAAIARLKLGNRRPDARQPDQPLRVLPYPGGRHPRIGFLDGALRPQRETKLSVFTPWDPTSYVVMDVPEALWSNLGLTYLAHTHIPTVWTEAGQQLPPQEWTIENGVFHSGRTLPNGLRFETLAKAHADHVQLEMRLYNGSEQPLSDLRVQNCVMLRMARGFEQQNESNKLYQDGYACATDEARDRWIISAWDPLHRCWGNAPCPCLHSDPKFPDTAPGERQVLRGWLSFYEGQDIQRELRRIEATGWKSRPFSHPK